VIQAYIDSQINLQHEFYIKVLNTNYRVQSQRKLKQSSKYNTIATNENKGELHILPTNEMPPSPSFTRKPGPLDGPPRRKWLSNPGCTDLLEVSGDTTCSDGLQQQP